MTRRAAIYCRISRDADGLGLGVERQRQDCLDLAARRGWLAAATYTDNDRSAYSGKPRPEYERMLDDLEAGRVDALVVWDVDRLTRTPVELERIIGIAERNGTELASVGGEIDLATVQGRLTARIKGSVARSEVEQQSRRIKRAFDARASEGKPHGKVPFGWERVDGQDVVLPDQAAVIRRIAQGIIGGESLRSITSGLNQQGVSTPRGRGRWDPVMTRQIALRDRNAGLRVHRGRVAGRGNWEPIYGQETHDRVVAVLRDPARRTSMSGAHRYLLSGIARCGECGEPLRILVAHGTRPCAYVCQRNFCVRRKQSEVDHLVTELVVRRLTKPDAVQLLAASAGKDVVSLVEESAGLRAKLDLVADQFANDEIDGVQLARITARLRPRLDALEVEIRSATSMPDLSDVAGPGAVELWEQLPLDRKRAVIRLLLDVRVLKIGKTGRAAFDPAGVAVTWRTGASEPPMHAPNALAGSAPRTPTASVPVG